jgi:hypothetical protein
MDDLTATYLEEPRQIDGGFIALALSLDFSELATHEKAVGRRCVVTRVLDSGEERNKGGAVKSIQPLQVQLDGGLW